MPFLSDSTAVWQVFHHKMHSMYLLPLCVTVVEKWNAYGETWCPGFDPQPGHTNRSLLECRSRTGLKRFSLKCYISSMFYIRLSTFVPIMSPYHEDLALPVASHIKKPSLKNALFFCAPSKHPSTPFQSPEGISDAGFCIHQRVPLISQTLVWPGNDWIR